MNHAPAKSYPITLVTAYFQLGETAGKFPHDYHVWMKNMLPVIKWPLVIFCDAQSVDRIKRLRGHKPAVYVVTTLEAFYVYRYQDIIRTQCRARWPDVNVDAPLVYNENPHFLRRAAEMNPYQSEMFFWCDAGMFRLNRSCGEGGLFRLSERIEWPNLEVCRASFLDKVGLFSHRLLLRRRLFKPHSEDVWITGMFFGGAPEPLRGFCDTFYQLFDEHAQSGRSVLSEEGMLKRAYATRPDLARLFPVEHIRWLRCLNFYRHPRQWWWYCLNGNQFPWRYFRQEITLRQVFGALFFGFLWRMRGRFFSS